MPGGTGRKIITERNVHMNVLTNPKNGTVRTMDVTANNLDFFQNDTTTYLLDRLKAVVGLTRLHKGLSMDPADVRKSYLEQKDECARTLAVRIDALGDTTIHHADLVNAWNAAIAMSTEELILNLLDAGYLGDHAPSARRGLVDMKIAERIRI